MGKQIDQKPKVPIRARGTTCLNCKHPLELSDRYCSYCGQINSLQKLSLASYFTEFAGSILNYDSRFRYTIKDLLFKPGTITYNYVNGMRHTYANPFRFYLSVSIVFFLLTGFLNFFEKTENPTSSTDWKNVFAKANDGIKEIPLDSISHYIKEASGKEIDTTSTDFFEYTAPENVDSLDFFVRTKNKVSLFRSFNASTKINRADQALDSLNYPKTRTNIWLYQKSATVNKILDDPLAFWEYMIDKTPLFIFFFTPFFALAFVPLYIKKESYTVAHQKIRGISWTGLQSILKVPYLGAFLTATLAGIKRFFTLSIKHSYVAHVIFIFHIFSFMFLGLLLLALPDFFINQSLLSTLFLTFICPFYFYKALRNFYKESRLRTLLKFLILNFVFLVLLGMSMFLLLLITAATY